MDTNDESNIWKDADLIHSYSRREAIEDGVLVAIDEIAREAGFRMPVAVTAAVWAILEPTPDLAAEGQDLQGRAWDMLTILRFAIRTATGDRVEFAPLVVRKPGTPPEPVSMWALCGPGDEGEPVITVMLVGED